MSPIVTDYKREPKQKYCGLCVAKLKRRQVFMFEGKRICRACFNKLASGIDKKELEKK